MDKLLKKFKLDKVLNYVEKENDVDKKVKKLEKRLSKLEKETLKFHPGSELQKLNEI